MKQEDIPKVTPVFAFFKQLFTNYSTEHWLIDDDIALSHAFVIDSGAHRVVLNLYRAFWTDHSISQINNLLLNYKPECVRLLQDK